MSDSDLNEPHSREDDRSSKRRRQQYDSALSTPRYRSHSSDADELGEEGAGMRRLSRDMRATSIVPRRRSGDQGRGSRSPSRDELDHTFYEEKDRRSRDLRRSSSPRSNHSSESRTPQHSDGLAESIPTVRETKYKLKLKLGGHSRGVSQVKFSPDGRWIASCSADATIKVWDVGTGRLLHTMGGHVAGINTIAWSPDSKTIASGSDDKLIRLWKRATGKPYEHALVGHHNYVFSLAFSPKGNMLVSGSYDESVSLWDVRGHRQMRSLPAHSDPVGGVDFVRDGTLVVSCSTDGLIRIWDTATGQCVRTLVHEDNAPVTSVRFSPNGKFVLAWTLDNTLRLWEYISGQCKKTYQGHVNKKYSIGGTFGVAGYDTTSPQAFIVSGSEDGRVFIWDVNTKEVLQEWVAHEDAVLSVDTHATREMMVTCSLDGSIKVWSNEDDDEDGVENGVSATKAFDSMEGVHTAEAEHPDRLPIGVGHGAEMMDYDTPDERPSSLPREED